MIRLFVKKSLYTYERIIFPDGWVDSKADVVRYMRFYEKPAAAVSLAWDSYRTPITTLTESEDTIRARYTKEVRYEVRRAQREEITYAIFEGPAITTSLLEDVEKKYYRFCDEIHEQHLKHNLNPEELSAMARQGYVAISKATFDNGWTYHVYQIDGKCALLWLSFSDYRKENANKSMAGWANRGLHDHDILYFKAHGYSLYDWGNIASEAEPNQIDKFKMSFGGDIRTAYCCFVGNTLKGKALIAAREIRNKG